MCALLEGDLQEARSREALLPNPPDFWTYDPTLITVFSARMKARREIIGQHGSSSPK